MLCSCIFWRYALYHNAKLGQGLLTNRLKGTLCKIEPLDVSRL